VTPPGVELDIHLTTRPGEARDLAASRLPGAVLLVAIGGDGTVADCAQSLIDFDVPLAVLPGGSTNITAREQGVPVDALQAARLIFSPHATRRIDAGTCDDRIFLHMAGAGFDARFFAGTNPNLKRKIGWMAYLPAAMAALQHRPARFLLTMDAEQLEIRSPLILIANGPSIIHPRIRLHPDIRDDDGLLDVLAITATTPVELARTLGRVATMRLFLSPYLVHRRVSRLRLEADGPVPVEIDGDVFGVTPREFRVLPGAIRMIVPLPR
jgi:YegS/Rv2252/BmrU family lipid kinase